MRTIPLDRADAAEPLGKSGVLPSADLVIVEGSPRSSPIPLTLLVKSAHPNVLRCQMRTQSGADEDQGDRGKKDDSGVGAETEGARAPGQHESAQGIDDVGQRIEMTNDLQPDGHDAGGVNRVAGKEQRHGKYRADAHEAFACFHDIRDDERKRAEQRRGKDNDDHHVEERQRGPNEPHPASVIAPRNRLFPSTLPTVGSRKFLYARLGSGGDGRAYPVSEPNRRGPMAVRSGSYGLGNVAGTEGGRLRRRRGAVVGGTTSNPRTPTETSTITVTGSAAPGSSSLNHSVTLMPTVS